MVLFDTLHQTVRSTGIWDGPRAASHAFLLSSEVYRLSTENRRTLDAFAPALRDVLSGVGQIAAIANTPRIARGPAWTRVRRLLAVGVPHTYRDISALRPATGPAICKVDLMERSDGSLCIAEIDGHNKHGMGYSTLGALLRRTVSPDSSAYPGVAAAVAREVKALGTNQVVLLSADQERFYLPEFAIIANALAAKGVCLTIVEETDKAAVKEHILAPSERGRVLLIDFPFLCRNVELNELLPRAYREGHLDFLFLPKPFLGSKALLGLLRNEEQDAHLEAILLAHIPASSLGCVRSLIPPTYLVGKATTTSRWKELAETGKWVIKDAMSSGMKGTSFGDEQAFRAFLARAAESRDRSVLQEQIDTRPHRLRFFTPDGVEDVTNPWYLRITAHVLRQGIADLVVTARKDRAVHGAKDCLMFGAAFA